MSFIALAVIGGVGAIAGGAIAAGGAESAASTQAQAAQNALNISSGEFNTITAQEAPFLQAGYGALNSLQYGLGTGGSQGGVPGAPGQQGFGALNAPFTTDMFKQFSPAYQFQLQQGQQGVLNSDSSGQGALSGAALKDLTGFNQGLANTSFQNAFSQYQTQNNNIYARLAGLTQIGSSAAANLGAQGVSLAGQEAQSAQNIGSAYAGGTVGAANAFSGALGSAGAYGSLSSLLSRGGGGSPYSYLGVQGDETAAAYSDRRLKEGIERIGETDAGIPLYRYRYRGSPYVQIGVMADEAAKVTPNAVIEDEYGFMKVDYGMIR